MRLFDAVVGGIFSYGAEVWGWKKREEIDRLGEKYEMDLRSGKNDSRIYSNGVIKQKR